MVGWKWRKPGEIVNENVHPSFHSSIYPYLFSYEGRGAAGVIGWAVGYTLDRSYKFKWLAKSDG